MKREYTLLTLGILIVIIPYLGLTPSLRQIVFTLLGAWVIFLSYKYWKTKYPTSSNEKSSNPLPEPAQEQVISSEEENQNNYERRQDNKPRI